MKNNFPLLTQPSYLDSNKKTLLISSYGFEDRTLGWTNYQVTNQGKLSHVLMYKYSPKKGDNKIKQINANLEKLGISKSNCTTLDYNVNSPNLVEFELSDFLQKMNFDEIVVDITSMTKFLILICLASLRYFDGTLKIVYTEGQDYSPSYDEYINSKEDMAFLVKYPSQGVKSLLRANCLTSIRMQGQPTVLVAFTSFNEQLIRHLLGSLNPHRIIFINGVPPRDEYVWRAQATQEIHKKLISDYSYDNPVDEKGYLINSSSTLSYNESISLLNSIYEKYGNYERIVCGATGSKMQTVGLLFAKLIHPDIHIEYPTPDSYYSKGLSIGIKEIHEIKIDKFSSFISLQKNLSDKELLKIKN